MPKVQYINPDEVRKPGMLEFKPIPVNQYSNQFRLTSTVKL